MYIDPTKWYWETSHKHQSGPVSIKLSLVTGRNNSHVTYTYTDKPSKPQEHVKVEQETKDGLSSHDRETWLANKDIP